MSKEQNPNTCQQDPTRESIKIFAELLNIQFSDVVDGHPCKETKFARFITESGQTWNIPLEEVLAGARKFLEMKNRCFQLECNRQALDHWRVENGYTTLTGREQATDIIGILETKTQALLEQNREVQQRNNVVALLQKQLSDLEKELCAFQGFLATRGLSSTEGSTITQKIMLLLMSWEMKLEEAQEKNGQLAAIIQRRQEEELADAIARPLEDAMKGGQDFIHKMAQGLEATVLRTALDCAGQEQKKVFKVLDKLLNSEDAGEFSKAQIKGRKILNAYNQAVKEHKDNG